MTPLLNREQLARKIEEKLGLKLSPRTLANLCSQDKGPPVSCRWGSRPMYDELKGLQWALDRCTPGDQEAA